MVRFSFGFFFDKRDLPATTIDIIGGCRCFHAPMLKVAGLVLISISLEIYLVMPKFILYLASVSYRMACRTYAGLFNEIIVKVFGLKSIGWFLFIILMLFSILVFLACKLRVSRTKLIIR